MFEVDTIPKPEFDPITMGSLKAGMKEVRGDCKEIAAIAAAGEITARQELILALHPCSSFSA